MDRPGIARLRGLDDRLASPPAVHTLAAVLVAMLTLQGAVVLDRSLAEGHRTDATAGATTPALPPPSSEVVAVPAPPAAAATTSPLASAGEPTTTSLRGPDAPPASSGAVETGAEPAAEPAAQPAAQPAAEPAGEPAAQPAAQPAATDTGRTPPRDPPRERFEASFPAQAGARQDVRQPATTRWAVLIGINEHQGRTRDNLASRQDAEDLARHLRSRGWRDDHVVLLSDAAATRENIVEALRWLGRKTTSDSVVVVHYSGHTKQWPGRDVDGDGETTDEAFWPTDNHHLPDGDVVDLLAGVRAARLWFNVGACEAAGFADPGLAGPGRVLTFSSREDEKSYEDPERGNSVWGFHLFEEGLIAGAGDRNGDGVATVEEAFAFASPRAATRTHRQATGPQHPVIIDRLDGDFDLRIPPPPPPTRDRERSPNDEPEEPSCGLLPPCRR